MVTSRRVTVEEFESMPLEGKWELIDGEVVELTLSAGRSAWIGGELFIRLNEHVEPGGLGWAFSANTGFVLFPHRAVVRSPIAAFVRRDRLPELSDHFVPVAPDFAVEVLSPWDDVTAIMSKIAMYRQAGVRLVWLIDPAKRTVTIFHPDDAISTHHEGDMLDGEDVIPGFTLSVAEIFG